MKIAIISTYPLYGSKNVGDILITEASANAIRDLLGTDTEFVVFWREDNWESIKSKILDADFILFACLAIRKNMLNTYPYLDRILSSGIPYGVIGAGTSLTPLALEAPTQLFTEKSLELLQRCDKYAAFFTTRGLITQSFCETMGLFNAQFVGDIAFYDQRFCDRRYREFKSIQRIAISDPHRPEAYLGELDRLTGRLSQMFPDSSIEILLHGVNPTVEEFASRRGFTTVNLYESESSSSLDYYDNFDLHVGFRVHGHVSMLNRRRPSYLLEQDGRGCDYGLTIDARCSVPAFQAVTNSQTRIGRIRRKAIRVMNKYFGKRSKREPLQHLCQLDPVDIVCSMIESDRSRSFSKFLGLEGQIVDINEGSLQAMQALRNN